MKALHHLIWLFIIVILQPALIGALSVFGVSADLFLCFVAVMGFFCGRVHGTLWGMIFGLVFDIYVGRLIGAHMLSFALIGYVAAIFSDRFYSEPAFYVFMCIGAIASVINDLIYLVPYSVSVGNVTCFSILRIFGISAVLNGILIIPVEWCLKRTFALCRVQNTKNFR